MITKVRMDGYARFVAAEASGPTDMYVLLMVGFACSGTRPSGES